MDADGYVLHHIAVARLREMRADAAAWSLLARRRGERSETERRTWLASAARALATRARGRVAGGLVTAARAFAIAAGIVENAGRSS